MTRAAPQDAGALAGLLEARYGLSAATLPRRRLAHAARLPSRDPEVLLPALEMHETTLFRHPEQLRALGRSLPDDLRFWSAGSATGEEAVSLLGALAAHGRSGRVVATDVRRDVLRLAETGRLPRRSPRPLPRELLGLLEARDGALEVDPFLLERIECRVHNLVRDPPLSADVVLLRNVLIYFTARARELVLGRLARDLAPGSLLVLSPAEAAPPPPFALASEVGPGVYRRTERSAS